MADKQKLFLVFYANLPATDTLFVRLRKEIKFPLASFQFGVILQLHSQPQGRAF